MTNQYIHQTQDQGLIFTTPKGTVLTMLNLRGKKYLQVASRLLWFREEHPDWGVTTEIVEKSEKHCIAKAVVADGTGRTIATAHKREDMGHFGDFIEKAETGAIGRALALCGYGTQFAEELDEGERIVDAPVVGKSSATHVIDAFADKVKLNVELTEILAKDPSIKDSIIDFLQQQFNTNTLKNLSAVQLKRVVEFARTTRFPS